MKLIGDYYEEQAVAMLKTRGLHIIDRNFSRKTGEIDIIALDNKCLVFLEVRVRSHRSYARAAASVDRRKQQRIIRTAQLYLHANPRWAHSPCRFDVIAFEPRQSGLEFTASWIRAAFTA
jgi:putative endonuclease